MLEQKGDTLLEISVYHCQQSSEKAIKGYLAFNKLRFGKTHIIIELINIMAAQDPVFAELLKPADKLTIFATAFRYPEEGKEEIPLTRETAENALKIANWVLLEIQNKLPTK